MNGELTDTHEKLSNLGVGLAERNIPAEVQKRIARPQARRGMSGRTA